MKNGRLSILLVDDDEDDFILTRTILAESYQTSFEMEWASSYEAGRQALLEGRHDVCLLDYLMGARSGLDLLREAASWGCRTPVILLTGKGDHEVDVEAMKLGAADYLVKGQFGASLLERSIRYAIEYAVERQRTREALRSSEERYELAVRGANDGLWDWDLTTGRVYYAPRWKAMLGCRDDQVGDSPDEWLCRVHPLDVERIRAEVAAHQAGKTESLHVEYRIAHDDGSYRWMLTRGLAVRDERGVAVRMAGSQTDITHIKETESRLYHDAFHDALTGLPNRALFHDRLGRALLRLKRRPGYRFAVLFIDLDGFKVINDSLGHQTGDQLLIAFGRRLEGCVRQGDTIARLGGDEFIVLIDDVDDARDVPALADRVLEELRVPFVLNGHEIVVSASIGVALSEPGYDRAEEVLRDADIAMYQAKSRGKGCHAQFDKAMHAVALTRMKLEADLRQAADRGEYRLHYQPIVGLRNGRIAGFEALIRWEHPERGLVSPGEFIAVAEETKMILPLGMWVLREAAEQVRRWQARFRTSPPLWISVNLSCRQFFQPDLGYQIERALLETGLDARCLRLEITESSVMDKVETALAVLGRLKTLGVGLSMDDFGRGYSSLSYLHQFPFDTLKIDRSFVGRMGPHGENSEIVRTIVSMAGSLGLDVVAEGVETTSQLATLRALDCQYAQGYLFSRPLPAETVDDLLAHPPRWHELAVGANAALPAPHGLGRLDGRGLTDLVGSG